MKHIALFFLLLLPLSLFAEEATLTRSDMISSHPNDPECIQALQLAEKFVHDNPPQSAEDEYRLVGLYFVDERMCQVFNIMPLQSVEFYPYSAHEVLEAIFEIMKARNELHDYESADNGRVYRLYESDPEKAET